MTTSQAINSWMKEWILKNTEKFYPSQVGLISQDFDDSLVNNELDWELFSEQINNKQLQIENLTQPIPPALFDEDFNYDENELYQLHQKMPSTLVVNYRLFVHQIENLTVSENYDTESSRIDRITNTLKELFDNYAEIVEFEDSFDRLGLEILFISLQHSNLSPLEPVLLAAIKKYPHKPLLYSWLSDVYLQNEMFESALEMAIKFVSKVEDDMIADCFYGDCINTETHTQGLEQIVRCNYKLKNYDEVVRLGELIINNIPEISYADNDNPQLDYLTYIDVYLYLRSVYQITNNNKPLKSIENQLEFFGYNDNQACTDETYL